MRSVNELTKQEATVLACVAKGWRNAKIASELYISIRTVETHLYRIFDKLGVSSRTEAALYVFQMERYGNAEVSRTHDDAQNDITYAGV